MLYSRIFQALFKYCKYSLLDLSHLAQIHIEMPIPFYYTIIVFFNWFFLFSKTRASIVFQWRIPLKWFSFRLTIFAGLTSFWQFISQKSSAKPIFYWIFWWIKIGDMASSLPLLFLYSNWCNIFYLFYYSRSALKNESWRLFCESMIIWLQGFFRRSIQQKIQYRPCTKNQQCSILRINRNRCQYCRLKKCIAVGMSRDGKSFWTILGFNKYNFWGYVVLFESFTVLWKFEIGF